MNLRLLVVLLPFLMADLYAQNITDIEWQDAKLANCVQKAAQKAGWKTINQVTQLKCHKMGIVQADELNQFTALQNLSLYNNKIVKLDLTALTELVSLNLSNNKLVDLKISGLNKIETLFLFKNKLKTVDLSGLASVKKVRLMQNRLELLDITPMHALETGYFFDNQLEDLQITGLDKLSFLDVKQNPMPDELYDFYDKQEGIVISHDGNADDWQ